MTDQQIVLTLATKVMGWKRYGETEFWYGDNGNLFDSSFWNPLQNIADAWQVVEKLGESFWEVNIDLGSKSPNARVVIYRTYTRKDGHVAIASTVQEAICGAALRAIA
ncbi:hypothetical protein [Brevibacillus sp. DP1.3A]|uniref:BC1872 family protein n=1 Tax=Brevibacillus sp. DP1.3A TaxID=2738867 RepID=UPI00156B47C9|nr:hypothetical protein [Brevibacillus sp. DP1.3A]UED77472.1 hypothetical protein HP399_013720 [Brevibacillus sp. DP1.3A]